MANAVERWFYLGDSNAASVWTADGEPLASAMDLVVSQIPLLANVTIQNLSSPGFRVSQGGLSGFGAYANRAGLIGGAIGLVPPAGIIIDLEVNDWATAAVTGAEFTSNYDGLIKFCHSMGMKVVCICAAWHQMENDPIQHADARYSLQTFRDWTKSIAQANGAGFIDATESPITNHPEYYCDPVHRNGAGARVHAPFIVERMRALGHWL